MKLSKFANLLVLGLVVTVAASGCKKKPYNVTPLPPPGSRSGPAISTPERSGPIGNTPPITSTTQPESTPTTPVKPEEGIPFTGPGHANWPRNEEIFKSDTVYFDFDSSVVKAGEKSKVAAVADYLKSNANDAVEIQGHCDERGTEEYNRALGERRALAAREALAKLGVSPDRIRTISYGKDKPADPGHDESAWSKNRRDDFVLLHPKAGA